jgi:hypothetical protein
MRSRLLKGECAMSQSHEILLHRLSRLGHLSEEDTHAIRSFPLEEANLRADQDIARVSEKPSRSVL